MNRSATLTLALAALLTGLHGAYTPTSSWIQDPDSIKPYITQAADFWLKAYDETAPNGFFSEVNLNGTPKNTNKKAILIQSRNAYCMAKAFMISGDEKYLPYAQGALQFMYDYGWNESGQGWWGQVNRAGTVSEPSMWFNEDIWSFWQHYQLIGIASMIEVGQATDNQEWLDRGNEVNDEHLWDATPGQEGYFARAAWGWDNAQGKGFTPTVDAMTTNTIYNYLLTKSEFRKNRLRQVADNILDRLVGSMDDPEVKVGFASDYNTDWSINYGNTGTSIGHIIKTAWCLGRAHLLLGDEKYKLGAQRILDQVWTYDNQGENCPWDHTHKICRSQVNWSDGTASGVGDWWSVEQAFTGGLMNWYISGKDEYLEMADQAIDFWMNYFWDETNGECYSTVSADGTITSNTKGNMFKGGYHSSELFYYVYLYGNLFYQNKPVTLYYKFDAAPAIRNVSLWPMEVEDNRLKIVSVLRNGATFASFNKETRTLTLPAGANGGGIYQVTFENAAPPFPANPWGFTAEDDQTVKATWMGDVYFDSTVYPWNSATSLGWIYSFTDTADGGWYYRLATGDFVYTSQSLYPFLYSHLNQTWLYVQTGETGTTIYRYNQGNWEALP